MNTIDYKAGERITLLCIIGNIVLCLFKLGAGFFGKSQAMVADAFHSASDIIATTVVLVSIKIAKKPFDEEHPYGHGKVEPLGAAFVGLSLIFAAFIILKDIVTSIAGHTFTTPTLLPLLAAISSIIIKEMMFRITYAEGKKINSESMMANAWDHRSDAFSSIGTFLGILGSIIGGYYQIEFLRYLDPIAGALVASLIFKIAMDILKQALQGLMDGSPGKKKLERITTIAANVVGVKGISDLKARYAGQKLFIDLAIEVDSAISVSEGHAITVSVGEEIRRVIKEPTEVLVHVDPHQSLEDQLSKSVD